MSNRDRMLVGECPIGYEAYEGNSDYKAITRMCESLWRSYLRNPKTTMAVPYWTEQFKSEKVFREVLRNLAKYGWVTTKIVPNARWGEFKLSTTKLLTLCTQEELVSIRVKYKYCTYTLDFTESTITDLTKTNGKVSRTGLVRIGNAKAGNVQFGYDTTKLAQHKEVIQTNFVKGMQKVRDMYPDMGADDASYDEVSKGILEEYAKAKGTLYTRGNNYSDTRGRAISSSLRCVGNPIGSKDMRALLQITY